MSGLISYEESDKEQGSSVTDKLKKAQSTFVGTGKSYLRSITKSQGSLRAGAGAAIASGLF